MRKVGSPQNISNRNVTPITVKITDVIHSKCIGKYFSYNMITVLLPCR